MMKHKKGKGLSRIEEIAKVALVQKDQLEDTANSLQKMEEHCDSLVDKNTEHDQVLSNLESHINKLRDKMNIDVSKDELNKVTIKDSLKLSVEEQREIENLVSDLDFAIPYFDYDKDSSWTDYVQSMKNYARANGLDIEKNPFDSLLSPQQKVDLYRCIEEDIKKFDVNDLDKYDLVIAAACGVITGFLDVIFVEAPGESVLQNSADQTVDTLVEKFAGMCGWKGPRKDSDPTRSAIGFLERKFPVNYDHRHSSDVDQLFDMSTRNHHLKSLAHSPSPVGLFCSIIDQWTGSASFVDKGDLIRISSDSNLQGTNLLSKLFAASVNWLGHIMSDVAGSSGGRGQGRRGTGVPIPGFELLQFVDVGKFGKEKASISKLAVKIFEEGYDARFGIAMSIPVALNEMLIRFSWAMKRRFYHDYEWKDCMPSKRHLSLRRMLLTGYGCLCLIDISDAAVRSGGQAVAMLTRMNFVAWTRFAFLGLREAQFLLNKDARRIQLLDQKLDRDMKELLAASKGMAPTNIRPAP